MCHCFYHFRGSCPLKRSQLISGVPKHRQDLYLLQTNHHLLIPQWMAPRTPSSARPVGHMTVLTTPPRHGRKAPGCINKGAKGEEELESDQMKMELVGVNWMLAAAGFLLCTSGGLAAPMLCHFNSRALCVYEGRHYSLGESWMDNSCMQCTCLHPVGVGCCETVHRPVDFPAWCEMRVESVTCKVSLVQTADPRLPCYPGEDIRDPSHGSLELQQQLVG